MATRTHVLLIDDIDGAPAAETLTFVIDGIHYEMDLSTDNAARFREDLAAWTAPARRVGGRRLPNTARGQRPGNNEIRAWARDRGHQIAERGRIPAAIVAEYQQATHTS